VANKIFEEAIQIEKHTLQQIVLQRPNDILGGIWFGSLRGYLLPPVRQYERLVNRGPHCPIAGPDCLIACLSELRFINTNSNTSKFLTY
jgi:hypothetical protein